MGEDFEVKLFVGPRERKTYYDWIVLLLKSRNQIIEEIRLENAYKKHMEIYRQENTDTDDEVEIMSNDEDEDVIISDWYITDGRINEDIEKLQCILRENKMFFVHSDNIDTNNVRIGYPLQEDVVNPLFQVPEEVKDFWGKYGVSDIVVFTGLY